jgi:hypothetical protein
MSSQPVSFLDISATGTPLWTTSFDIATAPVSLAAAPFPFEGAMVTQVVVSTNGWMILKASTAGATDSNKAVPSTASPSGSVVAPFWDDLTRNGSFVGSGNTYYKRIAAGEDPANPAPHWIVQWHHVTQYYASPDDDMSFEVKLFDNGVIEYHYAQMISGDLSNYADGNEATVWLENTAGLSALVVSRNTAGIIQPNSAVRFTP